MPRILAAAVVVLAPLLAASPAQGDVKPFGVLTCTTPVAESAARYCGSPPGAAVTERTRIPSFDNVPLDTSVALPPASAGDGPFPLIVVAHGWGGEKNGFDSGGETGYLGSLRALAEKGYAVLSATARGFRGSCGSDADKLFSGAACEAGFIRLDDYRYEAMDIAFLAGKLVDQGIARPNIGVGGPSYGGGVSLELAVLKNRMCSDLHAGALPALHTCPGLVPWTSPGGTPMSVAAAAPIIPWSDLVYSLVPNGRTLDYTITNPYVDTANRGDDATEPGIEKLSYVGGLFALGKLSGYYQPTPLADQTSTKADLTTWFARLAAGEPYADPVIDEMIDLIARFRSPYNMPLPADGPAPLFISSGWTDDLFPVDEALRFYNGVRSRFPNSPISLLFANHGHSRGANSPGDLAIIRARVHALFDHYVKAAGDPAGAPASDVETYLTACPSPAPAASPGPRRAATWATIHPGEIRFLAKPSAQLAPKGDPREDRVSDPIANSDACGSVPSATDAPGSATYRLPKVGGSGYTLLGSPTVIAKFAVQSGTAAQVAARLWDVAPDGSEILVAKGLYRPVGEGVEVFQLHANGWRFAPDHTPRLQLTGSDAPYGRASNSPSSITASDLQLRLPAAEQPDCKQVLSPATPVLPEAATGLSRTLAPGVAAASGGDCSSAAVTSTGSTPGTIGGQPLTPGGAIRGSRSAGGKGLRARIRFGDRRVRTLRDARTNGFVVRVTCSSRCRVRARMAHGAVRIGRASRIAKGSFRVRVRLTRAGARRAARHRPAQLRLRVRVSTPARKRVTQRTGRYVIWSAPR